MRLLDPLTLPPVRWKNGGGVTREIAEHPPVWRLSLADVASEGPFSVFAGQERVLTVIEGAGMQLCTPTHVLEARPGQPLRFSGDEPVTGRLPHGPVRDLNLIYDPDQVLGAVTAVTGARCLPLDPAEVAVYLLAGQASCGGQQVAAGHVILNRSAALDLSDGATALCILVGNRP